MLLHEKSSLLIFTVLVISVTQISTDEVPAILWNSKGDSLLIRSVTAFGPHDKIFADSLKESLKEDTNILVFAVNSLSLEDFSANEKPLVENDTLYNLEAFLDLQPHMLLPAVKAPLDEVHKLHCGVQEIVVDQPIDDSIWKSVSAAFEQSCVVILHISNNMMSVKKDGMKNIFLPPLKKLKNVVAVFTAMKSSWGKTDNEYHISRNLLATAEENKNFLNVSGCIFVYLENATLSFGKNDSEVLPVPPSAKGTCGNESSLELSFSPSRLATSLTVKFKFSNKAGYWQTKCTATMSGRSAPTDELTLRNDIGAAAGFSFSCGSLVLTALNSSKEVSIMFDRFQVQPFEGKDKFSDSFDCVPFFTVPIWMGVFVSFLFILILNVGIYALFSVRTMDRFDDPKGKTISVASALD